MRFLKIIATSGRVDGNDFQFRPLFTVISCFVKKLFATYLVGLAKILGHDSVETTQIYTQKRLADLESAVENVKFYSCTTLSEQGRPRAIRQRFQRSGQPI